MLTNELTPAQQELLEFCSHLEADTVFHDLHTSLSLSIGCFLHPDEVGDPQANPPEKTLNAWYATLMLLGHIHDIAMERRT